VADEGYQEPVARPFAFGGDDVPCPPEEISGFLCVVQVLAPVGGSFSCVTGIVVQEDFSFYLVVKKQISCSEGQDISKIQSKMWR
jgi:hypothetical protein